MLFAGFSVHRVTPSDVRHIKALNLMTGMTFDWCATPNDVASAHTTLGPREGVGNVHVNYASQRVLRHNVRMQIILAATVHCEGLQMVFVVTVTPSTIVSSDCKVSRGRHSRPVPGTVTCKMSVVEARVRVGMCPRGSGPAPLPMHLEQTSNRKRTTFNRVEGHRLTVTKHKFKSHTERRELFKPL
jgi:hypothetical protein